VCPNRTMPPSSIQECRNLTRDIARGIAVPRFYTEHAAEVAHAKELAASSPIVLMAESVMREKGSALGHGFEHAHSVAIDAAAVILCETARGRTEDTSGESGGALAVLALIAGFIHDIRRDQREHPLRAAEFAREFFADALPEPRISMIAFAIRNHEAFKEQESTDDPGTRLLADALYDADKFRWGPDNFLYTIWDMADSLSLSPGTIFRHYGKGIEGIERIRHTFRTGTGRAYGPDFIERGLEIGRELYRICGEK